jgi:hypothetical protein
MYAINDEPTEATAYIKRLVYPGSSTTSATYLSGIIQTSNYDYVFHGDESSGKTYVTKQDPSAYPDMPEPLRPDNPDVDVDDTVDEYDGSGLPPASSAGGGRTKRKESTIVCVRIVFRILVYLIPQLQNKPKPPRLQIVCGAHFLQLFPPPKMELSLAQDATAYSLTES